MDGIAGSNEEVMVGGAVAVSPETAQALAQCKRRRDAKCLATIYRSRATGGQPEDAADEEEIEIGVDGYFEEGGFTVYGAERIDTGAAIELTEEESSKISEDEEQAYCDRADEYAAEGHDRAGDR